MAWWGGRTDWKTLYSGMEGRDLQQVESELSAAGVTYQTTPDGSGVQVPAELLDKARMEVAAKGMPQSGRMGFELFDKPNWVGSEFDEKVNYQRALEGELEHTIATIGSVRSARVHLVLAKDSLFTAQQQAAKASVVMKLKRAQMPREEVDSIRNLVAGAVEGLSPGDVTLVDADGRANLNSPGASVAASDEEHALAEKLIAMLEPLAGRENVRATVNIAYDTTTVEKTDDVVDPAQVVALTSQKTDQVSGQPAKAIGVPGTASNTPSSDAKAALPVYPTAGGTQQTSHEENATFAVTRHTTHEESGPGRVARVSAAVVINDRAMVTGVGKDAKTVWKPRTAEEMNRLQQLAQAAVGFDAKRGDSVVLQNLGFEANTPEVAASGLSKWSDEAKELLRSQPELLRTVGACLLAALLMMFVVRPVTKQAMVMLSEPKALPAPVMQSALPKADVTALPEESAEEVVRRKSTIDEQGVLEYVAAHVKNEPMQSTRLLEAWIGGRERAV